VRLAYLVSRHQASHTFIAREIDGLRRAGVEVHRFAVRRAPAEELLTEGERAAAAETYAILPPRAGDLLGALARALRGRPLRLVSTLARALRLSSGGVRNDVWHLFYFLEAVVLWDQLVRRGVRHVHVHFANVATAVALLAAHLGERDGLSWSFTMHGPTELDDVTLYALAEKVRAARFVACISDYARAQLMRLVEPGHWGKLEIVHMGVDPEEWRPADREAREGRLCVLSVGRLHPDKGQELLVEAMAGLREAGVDAELVVVGGGPRRAALEQAARRLGVQDRVRFAGPVGQDRIRELYAAADVFCLTSFAEGVPVVLMEAMATGLPVVATQIMGIPELVRDGETGVLVPPSRSAPLVDALAALARDPHERRRLGAAARAKVAADYDVRQWVEVLRALFARYAT
jgi:glycosyltransferase involved in cell wall biosynthesis